MPGDIGADEIFRVGGWAFSRTSCSTKFNGIPMTGFQDLSGEESREGEFVHGQRPSGKPLGITAGLFMPGPLTFKGTPESVSMLCETLGAIGLGSYGNVLWPLTWELFENPALPTIVITWEKVKIEKIKRTIPTDASGLLWEVECKHQGSTCNGVGIGLAGIPELLANIAGFTVPGL